ncbi:MAG TPA: trypsin-like peptidase domain-containing protein [Chthonomonadaceae bacterium]|nr:trypsin-like peptidase domain-containing protein [Chthonomonadaceae bacterium]
MNGPSNLLEQFSGELAEVVERVAPSVVRVDDGTRLTATGIIWEAAGIIVSTSHGVERDEDLAIELADGTRHAATLIGRDPDTDLAVLRVEATGLPEIARAEPAEVRAGQLALALARPGSFGLQVTLGLVSARIETQTNTQPGYLLHTDAVLHPGFSGGALVDARGRLAGLIDLMFGRGRGVALGTPIVAQVAETILKQGRVQRGYLGVRTQGVALPDSLVKNLGLEQQAGLLVIQVEDASPAEQGGLLVGDILLAIEGQPVRDGEDLRRSLRALPAGKQIGIDLVRGGERRALQVTLGTRE